MDGFFAGTLAQELTAAATSTAAQGRSTAFQEFTSGRAMRPLSALQTARSPARNLSADAE